MMRTSILMAALSLAAHAAAAQQPATKAPETKQQPAAKKQAPAAAAKSVAPTKAGAAPTKTGGVATQGATKGATKGAKKLSVPASDTAGPPPTIYREEFLYASGGRRDPFNSLLSTNQLRPTMSDLKITGIAYDPSGRRSIATLRDLVTMDGYRVTVGSTLGRMRVSAIRPRVIVFTIDEFGTTRQDSLVYGDTTKARAK